MAIRFDYDIDLITKVRGLLGARWSQSQKCWHIPATTTAIHHLQSTFPYCCFSPEMKFILHTRLSSERSDKVDISLSSAAKGCRLNKCSK